MRSWIRVTASILSAGALVVMAAPWAAATTVSPAEWYSWLDQQQASFVERTRPMSLAVDLRVVNEGDPALAQANVTAKGIVNADGSMRVELDSPIIGVTVLCTGPARCWARLDKGTIGDRLWHRIPAREMASLRDVLPIRATGLPDAATFATDGSTGTADLSLEEATMRVRVSFADGAYTEMFRVFDASDGVGTTVVKSLTPTAPLAVRAPSSAAVGSPLDHDVIPQLP